MSFGAGHDDLDGFEDPFRELHTVVDRLAGLDPVGTARAELSSDLVRFARDRDRQDATFAAWVLAAHRQGIGVVDGYVDMVGWLAWKTCRPVLRSVRSSGSRTSPNYSPRRVPRGLR